MQLDRLAARIRPRAPWEGIDLGFALARHWFVVLWGLWCLGALPLGIAAALWLSERPDLWILLVWWLKPLFEAPLLFWLSRALFGAPPSLHDLWRARRKVLPLRLLPNLLWRRLHPNRSFQLPLLLLEGLSGRERKRRWRVIQGTGGTGTWLTVICAHLESILWFSALLLVLFLVPEELPRLDPNKALFEVESAAYWISAALFWLAMSVMAPFYVAAGFALYLTRRTELEAWDLELVFRQAATREEERRLSTSATLTITALLVLALWNAPGTEAAVESMDPEKARALIAEVLAGEDFGTKRERQRWVYVGSPAEDGGEIHLPDWLGDFFRLIAKSASPFATLVKWVFILLAVFGGVLVLRRILHDLRGHRPEALATARPDAGLRPLGRASTEALPEDVEKRVQELIAAGDPRAALALLYRASIARLKRQYGLTIPPSATEQECLELAVQARPGQDTVMLRQLTGAWLRLAYGHRQPNSEELDALLRGWRQLEGRPSGV